MIDCELQAEKSTLEDAGRWVERFLNDIGGDYFVTSMNDQQIVLGNCRACPSFNSNGAVTCNEMEVILSKAITVFDGELSIGFTSCSKDNASRCEVTIALESI